MLTERYCNNCGRLLVVLFVVAKWTRNKNLAFFPMSRRDVFARRWRGITIAEIYLPISLTQRVHCRSSIFLKKENPHRRVGFVQTCIACPKKSLQEKIVVATLHSRFNARVSSNIESDGEGRRRGDEMVWEPGGVGSIKNSIHTSIRCFVGRKKAEAVREAWNVL